jgi:hypothetical protein
MSSEQEEIANRVIQSFQNLLGIEVRKSIGDQHFEALKDIVSEALAEHSEIILERVEAITKQLRTEIEKHSIEL